MPPPRDPADHLRFALSSRALRFRVVAGDESGFAVSRRIGLGGAIFKASLVPPVGAAVTLHERYANPQGAATIEAEVIAVIPEPTLDGQEPGFVARFHAIRVDGPRRNLEDFIASVEAASAPGQHAASIVEAATGTPGCIFRPGRPFGTSELLRVHQALHRAPDAAEWDDGLEEIDLSSLDGGPELTPTQSPPPPAPPSSPAEEPPPPPRKRQGLFSRLFGRGETPSE